MSDSRLSVGWVLDELSVILFHVLKFALNQVSGAVDGLMAAEKTPLEVDFLMHSFVGNEGVFFVFDVKLAVVITTKFTTKVGDVRCGPCLNTSILILGFSYLGSRRRDQNSAFEPAILLIRCDEKCETENGISMNENRKPKNGDLKIEIEKGKNTGKLKSENRR